MNNTKFVYESPDGGHTVYAREVGTLNKTIISVSNVKQRIIEKNHKQNMFMDILELSKTNPALKNALDNLIIIYNLTKENGS